MRFASGTRLGSEAFQRTLEQSPDATGVHMLLGLNYLRRGMGERAIAEIQKEKSAGYRYNGLAMAYYELGMKRESDEALARLLKESEQWGIQFAVAHATRGEADEAFRWLERSYQLHDSGIVMLRGNSGLRKLHSDPRWPRFLEKVGVPTS